MERYDQDCNIWNSTVEIAELLEMPEVINALSSYLSLVPEVIEMALELRRNPYCKLKPEGQSVPKLYRFGYNFFSIPKGNSRDYREINDPASDLKKVQQQIVNKLYDFELSPSATGCVPGRGLKQNILPHLGKGYLMKFDVKGAFNSTSPEMVNSALDDFFSCQIEKMVKSGDLTFKNLTKFEKEKFKQALVTLMVKGDEIPQGAPTSPYLFNIVFKGVDDQINDFLDFVINGAYTRYVDDLVISFRAFLDFQLPWEAMAIINLKFKQILESRNDYDPNFLRTVLEELFVAISNELFALEWISYGNSDQIHLQYLLNRLNDLRLAFLRLVLILGMENHPSVDLVMTAICKLDTKLENMKSVDSVKMIQNEIEFLVNQAGFELNQEKTRIWTPEDDEERIFTGAKLNKRGDLLKFPSRIRSLLPFTE